MSGVVTNGQHFERCNQCGGWELYERLAYAPINRALLIPSWAKSEADMSMNVDMCTKCMDGIPWNGEFRSAQ